MKNIIAFMFLYGSLMVNGLVADKNISFTETFDQQVVGTRMLPLQSKEWSTEPNFSNATNALGNFGLDTDIFLNSYDTSLWTVTGNVDTGYRSCHIPCNNPGTLSSKNLYGTGQWEFIVNWTDSASSNDGGIFLLSDDDAEGMGWQVSNLFFRVFCFTAAGENFSQWYNAADLTAIDICIGIDWQADKIRFFNGEGVFDTFTTYIPTQKLRTIIKGSKGSPSENCEVKRISYGPKIRPYALDYHVFYNGAPTAGNREKINPILWLIESGDSTCYMPWNYSSNTRYQEFTGGPCIARIPRHGPFGPGTEYSTMSAQFMFNNESHGFVGLAYNDYRKSLSNRVGFLKESNNLYAYSSGPDASETKTFLGAKWSTYSDETWMDITFDWQSTAIFFYCDGKLVATHTDTSTFPEPSVLSPIIESRTWPRTQLAGLRLCKSFKESQVIFNDTFDKEYSKYWKVQQDDFESNIYTAGVWTDYAYNKPDGIPEIYPEITPVENSILSNSMFFYTRSEGGSFENAHHDSLGLTKRGNATPFGIYPVTFIRFYVKVDKNWTFHRTRVTDNPLNVWLDGNKYMKSGAYLAQQAEVMKLSLGNPRSYDISFGIGDPQYSDVVRGLRVYGHTRAIVAKGTTCAVYPDSDTSASWITGLKNLWRAHYPNRKSPGTPLLEGSWQEGHEEHRCDMSDYNFYWQGFFKGANSSPVKVISETTHMNGGVMRGGYMPLVRDRWYYFELEIQSTIGTNNGVGLYTGLADDVEADDDYYKPDLYFTAADVVLKKASYFNFNENHNNGGEDKWSSMEIGPLNNQFQWMKGVYISDLVISKTKVGNTWANYISNSIWDTSATVEINGLPDRLDSDHRNVTLNLSCPGASEMIIHHTRIPSGISRWEPYSTTKSWTLPFVCGKVKVYATFKNGSGTETKPVSYETYIDIPPTLYSNVHKDRMALNTPASPVNPGPQTVTWLTENIVDDEPISDIRLQAYFGSTWHEFAVGLSNVGSHSWIAPSINEPNAKLRIIVDDSFGHSVTGTTETFAIIPEPAFFLFSCLLFFKFLSFKSHKFKL